MKRRGVLLSAAAAGALVVGWGLMPARSRLGSAALLQGGGGVALNGWIRIEPDGSVVLAMPRSEMGQGVHTALPMLAAEELDLPLSRMRIAQAGADAIYGNVETLQASLWFHPAHEEDPDGFRRAQVKAARWVVGKIGRELGLNVTGGSSSVADAWPVVRLAAATARASLLGAASLRWKLPVEELVVADGRITHPSGRTAGFGELAQEAAATPPGEVRLKARKDWKLIGQPAPRLDLPAKVDGSAVFGLDVRLPGMKYAAVRLCPMIGGFPGAVQADRALALPGAERLVMLPAEGGSTAGFAVVGRSTWHARRAVQAVQVDWQQRPGGGLDSQAIQAALESAVRGDRGFTFHAEGDVDGAEREAARVVEAWYAAPYLAHATMEPMNCTARVAGGKVELWVPTQVPGLCRDIAARVAGVPVDDVTVHVTLLGGGFGRRLEVDYAAYAVRVAMDCGGAPVQLAFSREEDMQHDFYRPLHVARLRAAVDREGRVTSLRITSAGDDITPRWMARGVPALSAGVDTPDKTSPEGLFDQPYAFGHQRMRHVSTRSGVPVGFWRSVGHSHNAFMIEGFMDELATAVRQDPLDFRRAMLRGSPRHVAVLELAAAKAGWGTPLPAGRARGIALHESFGSVVAQVVEASLEGGRPRVHRVVCAADVGTVVNPNIVAQQMEGAVVFALGAALYGKIDIRDGQVQQANFPAYPMVRMADAPTVETWLVPSNRPPAGVGEPGVPPLAPALAQAIFQLTGKRLRSLPFNLA
ncbi:MULTISPECIES: molybdopterin cofactor-binding domain-containing protein [Ramlibacter]|uniref:Xanthine dehydrogenase family protein molybdopterin-binding subunit n=1 Tax=Ramlibacter aquaticus TaxID=2780094 RepID=A0ABR9SK92_9BURK|nr:MULTISPECIES: molybdopterin cofactor-binding domain-containing protein [Ramlibacter]MBE7942760.1 xanthine dehydrogenase family protein molybdopterin-binding subunit [Ramlibacter aquaticus]